MKHTSLKVEKRKVLGKKIKKLRREGIIPANVYGKSIKSEAVQVLFKDFDAVYKEVGETGLVDLQLGEKTIPVLIHNLQKNFRGAVLHADFFQVNLKEKVKTSVPIEIVGEPKAVTDKIGLLMNILGEVEVEALPENLPENIQVNLTHLANIGDQITVADLKAPEGVAILTDKEQVVSKIDELVTKEAQEEAAAEAAAAEAAKEEAAGTESAATEAATTETPQAPSQAPVVTPAPTQEETKS